MTHSKVVDGDFQRKPEEDNSYTRWYRYNDHIEIVWCSDPGRAWSAYDNATDRGTRVYSSRSELTAALDNDTVEWQR